MQSTRTLTVVHDGVTYTGQIATIESTMLGWEDHGIMTAYLHCTLPDGGIGVGGFTLDKPEEHDGKRQRVGSAYGLDHVMRIMETVGVDRWEKLSGSSVIVLFEGTGPHVGMTSSGIAGVHNDRTLILKQHAEMWRPRS